MNRIVAKLVPIRFPELIEDRAPDLKQATAHATGFLSAYAGLTTVQAGELGEALRQAAMILLEGELVQSSPNTTARQRRWLEGRVTDCRDRVIDLTRHMQKRERAGDADGAKGAKGLVALINLQMVQMRGFEALIKFYSKRRRGERERNIADVVFGCAMATIYQEIVGGNADFCIRTSTLRNKTIPIEENDSEKRAYEGTRRRETPFSKFMEDWLKVIDGTRKPGRDGMLLSDAVLIKVDGHHRKGRGRYKKPKI